MTSDSTSWSSSDKSSHLATFQSISANTAATGIALNNTGTTAGVHGGLTVTGDATTASNGSGGLIANSLNDGILLFDTRDVSRLC